MAAVVLRKVAKGLRFDCGQYGSFAVFAVHLRFLAVLCRCKTAENRGLNCILWNGYTVCVASRTWCFALSAFARRHCYYYYALYSSLRK